LIIQDLCKQCPHPVPCANACPNDAIVVKPPTNARVVDRNKCIGCKMCLRACPWEMLSFDPDTNKAVKCFLCDGTPKCVEACPSGALTYVAWLDLTDKTPPRIAPTAIVAPEKAQSCNDCHKR
jgi:Fe-S-cluster-containing hydrogenase component 2